MSLLRDFLRGRGVLGTLFRYEIKMVLRDKRTVLMAVVAPLVLFPAIIFIMRYVERSEERRLEETTYEYAVVGDRADWARSLVQRGLALRSEEAGTGPARESPGAPDLGVVAGGSDGETPPIRFEEREVADPDSLLAEGDLHLIVEGLSPEAYARVEEERRRERAEEVGEGSEEGAAGAGADRDTAVALPTLRLKYRGESDFSRTARNRMEEALEAVRAIRRDSVLLAQGFPLEREEVAPVEERNVASAEKEAGAILGLALTPFLLFFILPGGSIVAVDAISGEKERGTLETLLTTAARRSEIVSAKLLAVVAVGMAVAVVNVLNLLLYVVVGVLDLPENFSVALSGLDLALLLVLFTPLTVLVASVLLLLSGYAKTYKEYQIYFFPVFLVFVFPAFAAALPGMELRSAIALVPISGVGVAVREIMVGEYDWLFIAIAFLSTAGAAWWSARLTTRTLSTEKLISSAELDEADLVGGTALFPRHVFRWFLVMWAVFFVVSSWFQLELRLQILVNLVGMFFLGSLLMIRHYRLDPRKAFALRGVHPAVWLAVLVGAPSALITGIGMAELVNAFLFPVPERIVEGFGEMLVAEELPLWQLVLFLSIMPGVFEELAFRGVLLHGLSRKLRPIVLCLAVGAIFGAFHVALFRIIPTAYLGVILAAVVVLTGSIFPAMLWHALNNAIALVPAHQGWLPTEGSLPLSVYPIGVAGLAVCFWILWRVRRPYPGLRKKPPPEVEKRGRGSARATAG